MLLYRRVRPHQETRPGIVRLWRGAAVPDRLPGVERAILGARLRGLPAGLYKIDGQVVKWNGRGIPRPT